MDFNSFFTKLKHKNELTLMLFKDGEEQVLLVIPTRQVMISLDTLTIYEKPEFKIEIPIEWDRVLETPEDTYEYVTENMNISFWIC